LIKRGASRKWSYATKRRAEYRKTEIVPRLSLADADAAPRRGADPQSTPGRCANLDYCTIGMQRILVEVPIGKAFVCPECGGKLRPPSGGGLHRPWVMPALRIAILFLGIGLGTLQGYVWGRMQPTMKKAVATVSRDTAEKVNAARALLGLQKLPSEAIRLAPAPPVPATESAAPPAKAVTSSILVADRPYPRKAPALDTEDPPTHLADEQHFGQVVVDCTLGALQVRPECHASNVRGGDAFSASAVAWLNGLSVQYAPGNRNGAPTLLDHRWRVFFEDFAGIAPRAKPAGSPRK
jgi:hypothetical protein